ncbi:unnamed protein product [Polarella glacialis]|uniref:Uncharacterized protein n=1 Tax=Polarella glacialis TaxID=89957 RepID=A0A813E4Z9_POLGL|nr:unnamed protein product [Polarella glacialis]
MALLGLFRSRLLPKAMQRAAAPTACTGIQSFPARFASTAVQAATGAGVPSLGVVSSHSPRVGSRKWYRRPGMQGPGGWLLWLVGWTSIAGFMQEIAGPYIFFHEPTPY